MRSDLKLLESFVNQERSRIRTWRRTEQTCRAFLDELHRQNGQLQTVTAHHILQLVEGLNTDNKPSTKCLFLGIIRRWYRYLYQHAFVLLALHQKLSAKVTEPKYIPPVLWSLEIDEWFSLCPCYGEQGLLDLALFELTYSCALRAGEVIGLQLSELDLAKQTLTVRTSKNDEGRTLPIPDETLTVLTEYLQSRRVATHLWVRPDQTRVSIKVIRNRINKWYRPKLSFGHKIGLRTLRHSCATHLLSNGADIRHIQQFLGHKSLESTQIYTQVVNSNLRSRILETHQKNRMDIGLREDS